MTKHLLLSLVLMQSLNSNIFLTSAIHSIILAIASNLNSEVLLIHENLFSFVEYLSDLSQRNKSQLSPYLNWRVPFWMWCDENQDQNGWNNVVHSYFFCLFILQPDDIQRRHLIGRCHYSGGEFQNCDFQYLILILANNGKYPCLYSCNFSNCGFWNMQC